MSRGLRHKLEPKGMEPGWDARFSSHADAALSVERRSLSHSFGIHGIKGKPVFLFIRSPEGDIESQEETMGMRVMDARRSECLCVIERIGIDPK